jgi:hypothetical protein
MQIQTYTVQQLGVHTLQRHTDNTFEYLRNRNTIVSEKLVKAVTLLTCIRMEPASNLGRYTNCPIMSVWTP